MAAVGFCTENIDCLSSTYCCSLGTCSDPSVCLYGNKIEEDMCDFGFECMSKCCFQGTCSPYFSCFKTCSSNHNC